MLCPVSQLLIFVSQGAANSVKFKTRFFGFVSTKSMDSACVVCRERGWERRWQHECGIGCFSMHDNGLGEHSQAPLPKRYDVVWGESLYLVIAC